MDRIAARVEALSLKTVRELAEDKLWTVDLPQRVLVDTIVGCCVDDRSKNELDARLARLPTHAVVHDALALPELVCEILRHVVCSRELKTAPKVCRAWRAECARLERARRMEVRFHAAVRSPHPNLRGGITFAAVLDWPKAALAVGCINHNWVAVLDETMKVTVCFPAQNPTGAVQWGRWLVVATTGVPDESSTRTLVLYPGGQILYSEEVEGTFESLCVHNGELHVLARNDENEDEPVHSEVLIFDHTRALKVRFAPRAFAETPAGAMAVVDDMLCLSDAVSRDIFLYSLESLEEDPKVVSGDVLDFGAVVSLCAIPGRLLVVEETDEWNTCLGRRVVSIDPHCVSNGDTCGRVAEEMHFEYLPHWFPRLHEADLALCARGRQVFVFDKFAGAKHTPEGWTYHNAVTLVEECRA